MTTSDELQQAKAVLIARGWYQGDYVNDVTGEVCIVGALNIVENGDPRCYYDDSDGERDDAMDILNVLACLDCCGDVGEWNDWSGRTPEQVLAFLDRAIAIADAKVARVELMLAPEPTP